jgi:hypothetical protein
MDAIDLPFDPRLDLVQKRNIIVTPSHALAAQ